MNVNLLGHCGPCTSNATNLVRNEHFDNVTDKLSRIQENFENCLIECVHHKTIYLTISRNRQGYYLQNLSYNTFCNEPTRWSNG